MGQTEGRIYYIDTETIAGSLNKYYLQINPDRSINTTDTLKGTYDNYRPCCTFCFGRYSVGH